MEDKSKRPWTESLKRLVCTELGCGAVAPDDDGLDPRELGWETGPADCQGAVHCPAHRGRPW